MCGHDMGCTQQPDALVKQQSTYGGAGFSTLSSQGKQGSEYKNTGVPVLCGL